ncbi:MAG: DnaD domain protein [Clostridia bacterium]|nr:DnaD domain protein [Clostridia bacterium]
MQKMNGSGEFAVSKAFVFEQMQALDANAVKVYLYAKCLADENNGQTTCDALYEAFGEKELVQSALRCLVRGGCLHIDKNANISFAQHTEEVRPQYSHKEITESVDRDTQLQMLMQAAECVLGKMLTASAAETLFGMYDWLGLPADVILKLLEYCAENGKRSMAYIEKVAISWSKEGIVTLEAAERHLESEAKKKSFIYKAKKIFGIDNRNFTTREENFLHTWQQMGISDKLLAFGFDYTVDCTGKLSFAYLDKVLRAWREAGVQTPAQALKFIDAYRQSKTAPKKAEQTEKKQSIYNTEKYDYEEIRRLARKNIRQKLGKE